MFRWFNFLKRPKQAKETVVLPYLKSHYYKLDYVDDNQGQLTRCYCYSQCHPTEEGALRIDQLEEPYQDSRNGIDIGVYLKDVGVMLVNPEFKSAEIAEQLKNLGMEIHKLIPQADATRRLALSNLLKKVEELRKELADLGLISSGG